jgi:arylsulfatase A-like enzyme
MDRRDFIRRAGLGAVVLSVYGLTGRCGALKTRPNIIFIMADDMGFGDASCYNPDSVIRTPNIDRLASEGMRFTDAHSPSAVCTPTRYSLLTGRYCWRSRLKQGVFGGYDKPLIEKERMTVASLLKKHGYATACIGKWHLGMTWETNDGRQPGREDYYEQDNIDFTKPVSHGPTDLGFDYFFGTSGCTTDDPPLCFIEDNWTVGVPDRYAAEDPADEDRLLMSIDGWRHEDADFTFMEKALAFIDNAYQKGVPFFVYLPLSVPHIPWFPHEDFKGKSGAGPRGDQVLMADFILGEIMIKLDRLEIKDNTLLIFTSDNGPRKGVHGHESAWKWRGYKGSIWEGGHRIPFIIRWPAKTKPGSISDETIGLMDLMAACAAIVGDSLPDGAGEDSYNILPVLTGDTYHGPIRDHIIHHSGAGVFAIRQGVWKLIEETREAGYHQGPEPGAPGQLYNLEEDPQEQNNLWNSRPDMVKRLSNLLNRYREQGFSRPL